MTAAEKIKQLREKGVKIRVAHLRPLEGRSVHSSALYPKHELWEGEKHNTRGGLTRVVLDFEGIRVEGQAVCSMKDNFCKRLGLTIALNRALFNYNKIGGEL